MRAAADGSDRMIDFTLTEQQEQLRGGAREFAESELEPLVAEANRADGPMEAFRAVKPAYEAAAEMGMAFGHVPEAYDGPGMSNVDLMVAAEEIAAVDPGFGGNLAINSLAQLPILLFGSEEQKERWLREPMEAIAGGQRDYICGYVVSEGQTDEEYGGTANFDHPGEHPVGMGLTAEYDESAGEYVLDGRKYWPANAAGWDGEGADQSLFVVRTDPEAGGTGGLSALVVPGGTDGITYEPIEKTAFRTMQNVEIVCENARVPEENLLAEGMGDVVINQVFSASGPGVAITAVGCARAVYEYVLEFAKEYTAGGSTPIFDHQAVGYELFDVGARIEACRTLCWKAAHYLDENGIRAGAAVLSPMTKVFVTETCVEAIYDCMKVMGINAVDADHPVWRYFRDAAVLPMLDGGNLGMQRKKAWGVMADDAFDPGMFVANRDFEYEKSMEGKGLGGPGRGE